MSKSKPTIVRTATGHGAIAFPGGGRIQSRFTLTEYTEGPAILTCEGVFTQASYRGWEQLVHQYRLGPGLPRRKAQEGGLVESFTGHTTAEQPLHIPQMLLISAEAWGVDGNSLRLQMEFDCLDWHVPPEKAMDAGPAPRGGRPAWRHPLGGAGHAS
jgi:hypothetical protein